MGHLGPLHRGVPALQVMELLRTTWGRGLWEESFTARLYKLHAVDP
jgi:hypothetical protein